MLHDDSRLTIFFLAKVHRRASDTWENATSKKWQKGGFEYKTQKSPSFFPIIFFLFFTNWPGKRCTIFWCAGRSRLLTFLCLKGDRRWNILFKCHESPDKLFLNNYSCQEQEEPKMPSSWMPSTERYHHFFPISRHWAHFEMRRQCPAYQFFLPCKVYL